MTRTTHKTLIATALGMAIVLALGTLVLAQPGFRGHGGWRGGHPHMSGGVFALRGLDLSEEQRAEIRSIHEAQRTEFRALAEKLGPARQALQSVALAEPLDEVQLQTRAEELALVQTEMAVLQAKTQAAVFQVLTPEQREEAKARQVERRERHAERMQKRMERRQGNN